MWKEFRGQRSGVVGLIVLLFFVLVAILAPVLADSSGLDVTLATGKPIHPPSTDTDTGTHYWLGTDKQGRAILTLLIWGSRISLMVGFSASIVAMVIGTLIGIGLRDYYETEKKFDTFGTVRTFVFFGMLGFMLYELPGIGPVASRSLPIYRSPAIPRCS